MGWLGALWCRTCVVWGEADFGRGEMFYRTDECWEWLWKWRPRARGLETSWDPTCVSTGPSRAWEIQGNWKSMGGLGLELRPRLRVGACVYVFALYGITYRDGMSHLKCFYHSAPLTVCKRSSVEYSSDTHSMSFTSICIAAVCGFTLCWRLLG